MYIFTGISFSLLLIAIVLIAYDLGFLQTYLFIFAFLLDVY